MGLYGSHSPELIGKAEEFFFHCVTKSPFEERYFLEDFKLEAVVKNNVVVTVKPLEKNFIPYEKMKEYKRSK